MCFRYKKSFQETIQLKPRFKDHLYDITSLIELTVRNSSIKSGIATIDIKSKSSGITIQNEMNYQLKKAFIKELENIVLNNEVPINSTENDISIQKAALIGSTKAVSFGKNRLILSNSKKIFFCEFDKPGLKRNLIITISRN